MKNPFDVFQIPHQFDIDLTNLTIQYHQLVFKHHPDRGGDAITMEDINKAYEILTNPMKRARALVLEKSLKINDEETLTDPQILEEIFELRMSGDKITILQKQKEAVDTFKTIIQSNDQEKISKAYWRMVYLEKL